MNFEEIFLAYIRDKEYVPQTRDQLMKEFKIDKHLKKEFRQMVDDLCDQGLIRISSKKKVHPIREEERALVGTLSTSAKGFGFFISDLEGYSDVFIPKDSLGQAHNKDRVRIKITKPSEEGKNPEGKVVEILERNLEELVGTYQKSKKFGFVLPDDKSFLNDIYIDKGKSLGAKDGDKVMVKLIKFPKKGNPEGEIVEIIGKKDQPNVDLLSLVREYRIPDEFSKETKREVLYLDKEVRAEDFPQRKDFRDLFTVTIDGRDSKDFDDAISIERRGDNFDLYVHIADVSHYVKKGTALDADAYERGNSTYLYNLVIPMLPQELSNGICSLNPNEDRLALSLRMTIDQRGEVLDSDFYESLIKSNYRLVYDDVNVFLDDRKEEVYQDPLLKKKLWEFYDLYHILNKKRYKRGAIDFNLTESQIDVTDQGEVLNVSPLVRGSGNKMIEEFMLVANETVATLFAYLDYPFIYRIHEKPEKKKIEEFNSLLRILGYNIRGNDLHPKDFQQILERVKGKDEERVVNTLMLRTMQKARYSADLEGHFGLASQYYTHFTSPIRRYPDLIVHRQVKRFLHQKFDKINFASMEKSLSEAADFLSNTERRSEQCERDAEDLEKCKFMEGKIGQVYTGVISSVMEFGFFVELPNTVEGLFMYKFSPDRFEYSDRDLTCMNMRTKRIYSIGQRVQVEVKNVDVEERNIDFYLVDNEENFSEQQEG